MQTCQRPKCDRRAPHVVPDGRGYSGRSAGGHVPDIYYEHTPTQQHVTGQLTG